jgi:hypothetical protein
MNIAYAIEQLLPITPTAKALEAFVVHGEAFD